MEPQRSSVRTSRTPRTAYRPPPFGFTDVRLFIDKFETHYDTVPCSIVKSKNDREVAEYSAEESYFDDFPFDESASSGERVVWKIVFWKLGGILSGCVPSVTLGNLGACAVAAGLVAPKMITYLLLYPFCRLVFGTLYPAYASYKAVRTKNLKEYVKWMMYWIVFALFTCAETFTDVFLSWFPFYYEVKIILVLWLLSPATKGSSILYRKFVHPALCRREQEIDDAISKAKEQGYHTVLNLGSKGVNYATAVIMQTAIRGGGGLVQQLKKSYSLSDLTESLPQVREQELVDEADDVLTDPRLIRRNVARSGYNTRRSASESNNRTPLYFSEVDVDVRQARASHPQDFSHIKSSEDISSGYSSADNSAALKEHSLSRTGSVGASGKLRSRQVATRSTITTIKRPGAAEGSEVIIEELHDNESVDYTNLPPILCLPPTCHISQTDPPFLFEYVGNQIKIIQILGDVSQNFVTRDHKDNESINIPLNSNPGCSSDKSVNVKEKVNESTKLEIIPDTPPKDLPIEIIPTNDQPTKDKVDTAIKECSVSDVLNLANVPLLTVNEEINNETPIIHVQIKELSDKTKTNITDKKVLNVELKDSNSMSSSNASLNSAKSSPSTDKDDTEEANSIGTSSLNDDVVESDDEASYGTPDDSPKGKRKDKRGKYGKSKAPAPPHTHKLKQELKIMNENKTVKSEQGSSESTALHENKTNQNASSIEPKLVNSEIGSVTTHTGKPATSFAHGNISKKNRRQKSKSPVGRKIKVNSSPISKLMQLPGKFAFWHKTDDKSKTDTLSISSSDEHSRRSSTIEKTADDFQSCVDLQEFAKTDAAENGGPNENIPTITFSDSVGIPDKEIAMHVAPAVDIGDVEEAAIAKDILDKSDALQKLIEAKLERHPEYKIVPLHGDEVATTSRSTEV